MKTFITRNTTHVTYVLECEYEYQYVGRTTWKLKTRIREHIDDLRKCFKLHSASNHFRLVHNRDPKGLTFYSIDCKEHHWRGSNLKQAISKNETWWVFEMCTLAPRGLNIDLDLNCFISNY